MSNPEHIEILNQGVEAWNKWREMNQDVKPDLSDANLEKRNLRKVNFRDANLCRTSFSGAKLNGADFCNAIANEANFSEYEHNIVEDGMNVVFITGQTDYLSRSKRTNLSNAKIVDAKFNGTILTKAILRGADLSGSEFIGSDLSESEMVNAKFSDSNLSKATLRKSKMNFADFLDANLSDAILSESEFVQANFMLANLTGAIFNKADLRGANFIETKIDNAVFSESKVYGINTWRMSGECKEQNNLIISEIDDNHRITVDNIKIAQFLYLILNNYEIRDVLNSVTSKIVLILGRFSIPERKEILDELRNKIRENDLLPIVFDFSRLNDRDFTETIQTLAGLSLFVIADITNPKSSPLELQATVPDYQIPFVPIIQAGEKSFSMMADLQSKYNWVLDTLVYDTKENLAKAVKSGIIDPAMEKHNELRIIKSKVPQKRFTTDYIEEQDFENK